MCTRLARNYMVQTKQTKKIGERKGDVCYIGGKNKLYIII